MVVQVQISIDSIYITIGLWLGLTFLINRLKAFRSKKAKKTNALSGSKIEYDHKPTHIDLTEIQNEIASKSKSDYDLWCFADNYRKLEHIEITGIIIILLIEKINY